MYFKVQKWKYKPKKFHGWEDSVRYRPYWQAMFTYDNYNLVKKVQNWFVLLDQE